MKEASFNNRLIELQSTLERFSWSLTKDAEESKDLVQDTLLKALKYKEKFVEDINLNGWLYRVMKNIFINQYRRKKVQNTFFDKSENLYLLNVSDNNTLSNPERQTICRDIVNKAAQVSSSKLLPLKMYFYGYKYDEIAQKLSIPVGTVKNRIFQARKQIQEIIEQ